MKLVARVGIAFLAIASFLSPLAVVTPAAATTTSTGAVLVTGAHTSYGQVLFTQNGSALYVLSMDTVGQPGTPATSTCTGSCATAWPPLLASGPSGPFQTGGGVQMSHLGTIPITSSTGQTVYQVTYFGHPLYNFVKDTGPGQTNGENVAAYNGIWHLLTVTGKPDAGQATVSLEVSGNGPVLSTPTAFGTYRSLYMLTSDPANQSTCVSKCATIWPPLLTTRRPMAGPGVNAQALGMLRRSDGTNQVTYYGQPLYLYNVDLAAGAASGLTTGEDFVDPFADGVWYNLAPSGVPDPGMATVTSETSSLGTILALTTAATTGPFTLYAFSADSSTMSACTGACARAWPPVLTSSPPMAATGSGVNQAGLGTIARADGTFQVTYNGQPLYLDGSALANNTNGQGASAFGGTFQVVSLTSP